MGEHRESSVEDMTLSVVIPTSASVIRATIESVLRQTVAPDEILVLDYSSTDETVSILNSYRPKVSVARRRNCSVAALAEQLTQPVKDRDLFKRLRAASPATAHEITRAAAGRKLLSVYREGVDRVRAHQRPRANQLVSLN
jgi:glycosyltransferase involved in cell wall biosynthesis